MGVISSLNSRPIPAARNENSSVSVIERTAKAKGAPDSVIAQGPAAIKAWAQENGKIPAIAPGEGAAKQDSSNLRVSGLTKSEEPLKQLEPDGMSNSSTVGRSISLRV